MCKLDLRMYAKAIKEGGFFGGIIVQSCMLDLCTHA